MDEPPAPTASDQSASAMGNLVLEAGRLEMVVGFCAQALLATLSDATRTRVVADLSFSSRGQLVADSLKSAPFDVLDPDLAKDFAAWWVEASAAMRRRNDMVHSALLFDPRGGAIAMSVKRERNATRAGVTSVEDLVECLRVTPEQWLEIAAELRRLVSPGWKYADRIRAVTSAPEYQQSTISAAPGFTFGAHS